MQPPQARHTNHILMMKDYNAKSMDEVIHDNQNARKDDSYVHTMGMCSIQ